MSTAAELESRLANYLGNGGLFNPEMMEHNKVRDLLVDCRECLQDNERELEEWRRDAVPRSHLTVLHAKIALLVSAARCENCGDRATCIGAYEGSEEDGFACDKCCSHGNEDGHCSPLKPTDL